MLAQPRDCFRVAAPHRLLERLRLVLEVLEVRVVWESSGHGASLSSHACVRNSGRKGGSLSYDDRSQQVGCALSADRLRPARERTVSRREGSSYLNTPRGHLARETAPVDDLLSLAQGHPRRTLEAGEALLADGEPVGALFVLLEGELRIEKVGVPVAIVGEPGACIGEMSLLLGVPATADVVASERSVLAVIENADALLDAEPRLPLALARLLAERLQVMTTYLVDIKQQYADHEGGLGMVDVVLGSLMRRSGTRSQLGSERDPDPEY